MFYTAEITQRLLLFANDFQNKDCVELFFPIAPASGSRRDSSLVFRAEIGAVKPSPAFASFHNDSRHVATNIFVAAPISHGGDLRGVSSGVRVWSRLPARGSSNNSLRTIRLASVAKLVHDFIMPIV